MVRFLALLLTASLTACGGAAPPSGPEFHVILARAGGGPDNLAVAHLMNVHTGDTAPIQLPALGSRSMVPSLVGAEVFMGSDGGIIRVDLTRRSAALLPGSPPGQIMAISPDGNRFLIKQPLATVEFRRASTSIREVGVGFEAPGWATYGPDGTAYLRDQDTVAVLSPAGTLQHLSVPGLGPLTLDPAGNLLVVSGADKVTFIATCDLSIIHSVPVALFTERADPFLTPPSLLQFTPDAATLLGIGFFGVQAARIVTPAGSCPRALDVTPLVLVVAPVTFVWDFAAITPDSNRAFLAASAMFEGDLGLGIYDVQEGTFTNQPLEPNLGTFKAVLNHDADELYVSTGTKIYVLDPRTNQTTREWNSPVYAHLMQPVRRGD